MCFISLGRKISGSTWNIIYISSKVDLNNKQLGLGDSSMRNHLETYVELFLLRKAETYNILSSKKGWRIILCVGI